MSEMSENSVKQAIETRLQEILNPDFLKVEDVSWQHAGHAGARPGGPRRGCGGGAPAEIFRAKKLLKMPKNALFRFRLSDFFLDFFRIS